MKMTKFHLLLSAIILCTLVMPMRAEERPPTPEAPLAPAAPVHLSMQEAVSEAMEANPGLKALEHKVLAAKSDAKAASRTRWGELSGAAWYSKYKDDQILRPMSGELLAGGMASLPFDEDQLHYGLSFNIPLYMGGKLSRGIDISRLEAEKTQALHEGSRWQIRFNVVSLYSAAQTLDVVEDALGKQISALEKTKEKLDLMVDSGKRPEIDRLKVVESIEAARSELADARARRTKVGAMLLSLLGRDPSSKLEIDALPESSPRLQESPETLRMAVEANSELRHARLMSEQASDGVRIAKSSFIPKIFASGNYFEHDAPSLDSALDTWELRVGVSIPLLEGGARFERLGAAREREQAAGQAFEKVRLENLSKLEDGLAAFAAAQAKLRAAEARVAAGTEAARIEQIRYDTGAGTIEDLLRARAREEAARAALAQARGALITAGEKINSIVEKEAVK